MATNFQFPIAVHIMAGLGHRLGKDTTSNELAKSINTSASFIRRTLARLAKAELVETTKGSKGSCRLSKKASEISLLDIYLAVEAPKAFSIHEYKAQKLCLVSCHIKGALEKALDKTQAAMERSLADISLAEILSEVKRA